MWSYLARLLPNDNDAACFHGGSPLCDACHIRKTTAANPRPRHLGLMTGSSAYHSLSRWPRHCVHDDTRRGGHVGTTQRDPTPRCCLTHRHCEDVYDVGIPTRRLGHSEAYTVRLRSTQWASTSGPVIARLLVNKRHLPRTTRSTRRSTIANFNHK